MGYQLGVDLGTTYTAAAVRRGDAVTMLGLGNRAMQIPSVLYLAPDGTFLVGEAAEARAAAEPDRIAREFKRRIGDPVPVIVGGTPFSAELLTGRLLSWVVAVATEREGESPDTITVSYPANWSSYKIDLLHQAFTIANLRDVQTCTEPEAAAITYATRQRVPEGGHVAVYDLGGGTFDAAVLRHGGSH
jgi:molecular chaperone DnaK